MEDNSLRGRCGVFPNCQWQIEDPSEDPERGIQFATMYLPRSPGRQVPRQHPTRNKPTPLSAPHHRTNGSKSASSHQKDLSCQPPKHHPQTILCARPVISHNDQGWNDNLQHAPSKPHRARTIRPQLLSSLYWRDYGRYQRTLGGRERERDRL